MTKPNKAKWRRVQMPGRTWLLPAGTYRATVGLSGLLRLLATETEIASQLRSAGLEPLSVRMTRGGFVAVVRLEVARALELPAELTRLEVKP